MPSRRVLLALAVAALSLAQVSSELITPEIRRAGSRLACLCGSCKNSVGDCAMLGCHYSQPGRQKIHDMQAQGASDDAIVEDFIRREGKRALVVPPVEGFFGLVWWMPPLVTGLGLMLVYWFIRRMRKPMPVEEVDPKVLARFQKSMDEDLAKLDE